MDKRPLQKRLGEAIAALLMWFVFGIGALILLVALPLLILRYVIVGTDSARSHVKLPGKALDQVVNCAFFGGHPKETLSSHCGRYFEAKYGNPYEGIQPSEPRERISWWEDIPWWAHVVRWVTDIAEKDHVLKAIERPFRGMPL